MQKNVALYRPGFGGHFTQNVLNLHFCIWWFGGFGVLAFPKKALYKLTFFLGPQISPHGFWKNLKPRPVKVHIFWPIGFHGGSPLALVPKNLAFYRQGFGGHSPKNVLKVQVCTSVCWGFGVLAFSKKPCTRPHFLYKVLGFRV